MQPLRMSLALLLIGTPLMVCAAPTNDLLGIYRDALANDPVFASARYSQQAAQEREPQARAAQRLNISAGLSGSVTNFQSNPDFGPSTGYTYNSWGPVLNASWPIYRAQLDDATEQAKLSVTQSEAQLAQARQDLILRVTSAYFDVLASLDTLSAIAGNKQAVAENLAQAKREFEVGTKTIVDTHEAQARFDQITAQEQVAIGDLIVRRSALRAIIGRDPGELLPLSTTPRLTLPEPKDVEAWAKRAEESNFNVAVARFGSQIAQVETLRAGHASLPTVDLTAQLGRTAGNGSSAFRGDYTQRAATVGIQVNVPLYTGGLINSRIREAQANEDRNRQDLESARRNAAQLARQSFSGVEYGLAQVRALESAEVSAQSQLDSTRLGYQVGVRINLEVLNAQTQLYTTQRDLKRARYDFLLNGLRLKSAAGVLEENDVGGLNALLLR